jgi:hypothetical protein
MRFASIRGTSFLSVWILSGFLLASPNNRIICALGPGTATYKPASDERPTRDAMELAGRLNAAAKSICGSHCPAVALFRNPTVGGVMFIANGDQARLSYAPAFFASVHDAAGDAGVFALMAHELGHGLDDVMGAAWVSNTWTPELRADAWAGCVFAKSGTTGSELAAALATLAKYPAAADPSWKIRLPVIRTGYTGCGGDGATIRPH